MKYGGFGTFINCLIVGNKIEPTSQNSAPFGGGIHVDRGSSCEIINCTIVLNEAVRGGGYAQYDNSSSSSIYNTIIWGNTVTGTNPAIYYSGLVHAGPLHIEHCDIQGGSDAIGTQFGDNMPTTYSDNLNTDPLFINQAIGGNFRLRCDSLVRDEGDDSFVPADDFDIDGDADDQEETPDRDLKLRVADVAVDMGCYERLPDDNNCDGDITADGVVDVSDLLLVINSWGTCVGCPADVDPGVCDGDDEVTVSELLLVINSWGPCPDGPPGNFLTSPPESVDDCWSDCESKCASDPDPDCWVNCYNACVTALCEAEVINCDD